MTSLKWMETKNLFNKLMQRFFFNDTATTEIYTLSLHDALPILPGGEGDGRRRARGAPGRQRPGGRRVRRRPARPRLLRRGARRGRRPGGDDRSEERRVGKERRSRWSPYH